MVRRLLEGLILQPAPNRALFRQALLVISLPEATYLLRSHKVKPSVLLLALETDDAIARGGIRKLAIHLA